MKGVFLRLQIQIRMKQIAVGIWILLCYACNAPAQITPASLTLRGTIANLPLSPPPGLIEYWNTDRWQQLDTFNFRPDGSFFKQVNSPANGQCRIRVGNRGNKWSDFILPGPGDETKELVFDLDYQKMYGLPARLANSPDNENYYLLLTAYKYLTRFRDSLDNTPQKGQIAAAQNAFNQKCMEFSKVYKGSFTGDIVTKLLYKPQPGDYPRDSKTKSLNAEAFALAHSIDKTPFGDERVFYHNEFYKSLDRFSNLFPNTPEGAISLIEGLMSHRNGNSQVDAFTFRYLLDRMIAYNNEAGLTHLLSWFLPDCTDENPLPNMTQTLLEALKNCQPGKQAAALILPDQNGRPVDLSEVAAKNKLTLLFFWRSTCSHCKEFEPVLAQIYQKYHPLGVEVYSISSDQDERSWKAYLLQHPTSWINVRIPPERREEIGKLFPAPSTPTLIAVDKNRTVLRRLIIRETLEAYLEEELKK